MNDKTLNEFVVTVERRDEEDNDSPRTAKEIMNHIGYYNNSKKMTAYVRPLMEMGYLEMTEPDKPKSKNQKYRIVRKD